MTALKIALTVFVLFALPVSSLSAEPPEGQLYWLTDEYPSPDNYVLYDEAAQHTGAVAAIDYACTQNSGSNGTYTGTVSMYYTSEYTEKAGWCVNYHWLTGNVNGENYTAYLYCNGIKRPLNDMSSCDSPAPDIIDENNIGFPCEE
jgi:hypothetical protein